MTEVEEVVVVLKEEEEEAKEEKKEKEYVEEGSANRYASAVCLMKIRSSIQFRSFIYCCRVHIKGNEVLLIMADHSLA